MAFALDVEFARRYYRWFWNGSVGVIAFKDQRRRARLRPAAVRARYKATMQAVYKRLDLTFAKWDDDVAKTICEVCLTFKVPTLLVKVRDKGFISGDQPGDLVCARCHPVAETRITMAQVEDLTG